MTPQRDRPALSVEGLRKKISWEISVWEGSDELASEFSRRLVDLIIEAGWGNLSCEHEADAK